MAVPDALSDGVSASVADWSREQQGRGYDPTRRFLIALRDLQRTAGRRSPGRYWAVLRYRFWRVVAQADIPPEASIAGGLLMPHPNGIVVALDAVIGPNCLLMQQVTLGVSGRGQAVTSTSAPAPRSSAG